MAFSDEKDELLPECVTDYHLVDHKDELIPFSILPLHGSTEDEIQHDSTLNIFLRGATPCGLQTIHKKVVGWKFELSYAFPEIYVLSKDSTWIKLQKPKKSFEDTIRTVMITIRWLHFVKRNPEASRDAVWNHVQRIFRSQMVDPSENDLLDHISIIKKAATIDKDIAISKYLVTFLNEMEMPRKRETFHEGHRTLSMSKFIVDMDGDDEEDDDDESGEIFDSVCALCDNGGEVLICEGICIRSFHPTVDTGADSFCESLGFSNAAQYEALRTFLCNNCQYERHQCFICGMLGSSNKSTGAEVFPCVSATCGHFYHPKCVAEVLYPSDENQAEELQKQISAGESFACPAHKCSVCKQGENKMEPDLQFAVCRRCPKAYHRKCLPRKIAFGDNDDNSFQQRAWEGLLPKRILIYCTDHKIIRRIGTPKRDHILFPCVDREKKQQASGLLNEKVILEKRSKVFGSLSESAVLGRPLLSNREKLQKLVDSRKGTTKCNVAGDNACHVKSLTDKKRDARENSYITMKKSKTFKDSNLSVTGRVCNSSVMDKNKSTFRTVQSNSLLHINSYELKSKKQVLPSVKTEERFPAKPVMKTETHSQHLEDTEMQKRILKLMKDSTSSFNEEKVKKEQRMRCSHETYVSRTSIDKTITTGKVEASVKAVQAALKKLEAGCSIEEAKVVCEPEILNQLIKWKKKLRVYLAPFLHGVRYTSFGRHFTKAEKLKEIANRLHWYVKDGDMIVDFSCGANEFSCLMKEKLDEVGKSCSFKNYDLFTPPNDFGYEKRDWMSVGVEELPAGSRLIMGLNPPFGVEASLANQFIDKALKFKPKLLILIVPKETQRPDKKKPPYDIIWEDAHMLSGKAFYLPGSIDVHGEQLEDWNKNPPLLYLWSRPDWSAEHKTIAQKHGHLSQKKAENYTFGVDRAVPNYLMEENHDCFGDFSNIMSGSQNISNILDDVNGNCINGTGVMGIQAEETFDEIFTAPVISPVDCANSRSTIGANPYGCFIAPSEMHARNEGFQFTQTMSYSGHNPMSGSEYSRYAAATTVPHSTRIGCPQISENAYPSATAVWPPGNSYIQSAYPSQPYIQPPTASYAQTFSSEPDMCPPGTTTPGARYRHQSFPSYLRPPGTDYP